MSMKEIKSESGKEPNYAARFAWAMAAIAVVMTAMTMATGNYGF